MFETNLEVLNWYEKQPRAIDENFLDSINWADVKRYPIDKKFFPVMIFMRDVEVLTEVYHSNLKSTPTGKDKVIGKFMERWGIEEITHGELLNRFLNEAGFSTPENWKLETKREIPWTYKFNTHLTTVLTNLVGKEFTGVHMAYGAVNEMCTLQSYRRLIQLANHPVLTRILTGIMREESAHTQFYWNVAKLELQKSPLAQKLARWVIDKTWVPVGQGAKTVKDAKYTVAMLFGDESGLNWIDKNVTQKIQKLPGFAGVNRITARIGAISEELAPILGSSELKA